MKPRKTPEEQLAELQAKESQLKARIQKKRAEVTAKRRKQDTRRKIIAGAVALEHMAHDKEFADKLAELLDNHVTRPEDRKLLGL